MTIGSPSAGRLRGCRVLVTRPADQAGALADALRDSGATVVIYPTIEVVDPPDWEPFDLAFATVAPGDWVVLTSPSAVRMAVARLRSTGRLPVMAQVQIAAVGPGTAAALAAEGLRATVVPDPGRRNQEGLADALDQVQAGTRVVFARALEGRDALARALTARGVQVRTVPVSQTRPCPMPPLPAFDAALFASPSALRAFVERWTIAPLRSTVAVAIGPVTAEAMRQIGLSPGAVAAEPTPAALVSALAHALERGA